MPFTPEHKAGFDRLERSGYLPALRERIKSHTAPFFWHDDTGMIRHSGTLTFVDTGTEKLAMTADHVYARYLEELDAGCVYECQFGGVLVRPEALLLARDQRLDVATFKMPSVAMSAGAVFHEALAWPPPPPVVHEWLFYAGYPAAHRERRSRHLDVGLESLFGAVHDVSGSRMVFHLDFSQLHWPLHDGEAMNERLGGMSGGPVFRVVETGPITRLELVGLVYEHGPELEVVFGRSVAIVEADGSFPSKAE